MEIIMAETEFGLRLVALRKKAKLSQTQLASKAEMSAGGLRDLERGRREPTWNTVLALSRALGVSVAAFEPKRSK
jgi:transcriptional regulator with XRE-family HTH domain